MTTTANPLFVSAGWDVFRRSLRSAIATTADSVAPLAAAILTARDSGFAPSTSTFDGAEAIEAGLVASLGSHNGIYRISSSMVGVILSGFDPQSLPTLFDSVVKLGTPGFVWSVSLYPHDGVDVDDILAAAVARLGSQWRSMTPPKTLLRPAGRVTRSPMFRRIVLGVLASAALVAGFLAPIALSGGHGL